MHFNALTGFIAHIFWWETDGDGWEGLNDKRAAVSSLVVEKRPSVVDLKTGGDSSASRIVCFPYREVNVDSFEKWIRFAKMTSICQFLKMSGIFAVLCRWLFG